MGQAIFLLIEVLGILATVCQAVKITNIKVPGTFTIDASKNYTDNLILDCNYDLPPNETGFVLKWIFNDIPIYQWIPHQKPSALSLMKGLIDLTYSVSSDTFFKHKALLITKASWNLTGEYTCHVQTFQSSDKQTAKLQVIVHILFCALPERKLELRHETDDDGVVNIICIVRDIFPQPNIIIDLSDNDEYRKVDTIDIKSQRDDNGLYNAEAERKVQISQITCPTTIRCTLSLLGTNYTRRAEAIFYDAFISGVISIAVTGTDTVKKYLEISTSASTNSNVPNENEENADESNSP